MATWISAERAMGSKKNKSREAVWTHTNVKTGRRQRRDATWATKAKFKDTCKNGPDIPKESRQATHYVLFTLKKKKKTDDFIPSIFEHPNDKTQMLTLDSDSHYLGL